MRELKNKLTSGKNTKNIQRRKAKSFGYQVLGFGAGGGGGPVCITYDFFVVGGGGGTGEAGAGKPSDIEGPTKNFGCGGIGSGVCNALNGRGNGGNNCAATANQGGGGGRSNVGATGVVYLRFPSSCKPASIAISPSCNTIVTAGSCTVLKFIVSGCVAFE